MRIEVVADPAERAAVVIAEALSHALAARAIATLAVSGGSTPQPMLQALAEHDLAWADVHVVQVDERVAPAGDADRNLVMQRAALLDLVPARAHPMPVEDDDLDAAATSYADLLRELCGDPAVIDVIHLGLGDDGHTASLVPGDDVLTVDDRDVAVTGTYEGRRRMTLTYPALSRARQVVWLVAGDGKRDALRATLAGGDVPAAGVAQEHAVMITDIDAG